MSRTSDFNGSVRSTNAVIPNNGPEGSKHEPNLCLPVANVIGPFEEHSSRAIYIPICMGLLMLKPQRAHVRLRRVTTVPLRCINLSTQYIQYALQYDSLYQHSGACFHTVAIAYFSVKEKNDLLLTAVLLPFGLGSVVHQIWSTYYSYNRCSVVVSRDGLSSGELWWTSGHGLAICVRCSKSELKFDSHSLLTPVRRVQMKRGIIFVGACSERGRLVSSSRFSDCGEVCNYCTVYRYIGTAYTVMDLSIDHVADYF